MWWLAACDPDPPKDGAPEESAPPLETGAGDTDIQACGLLGGLALGPERVPGETLRAVVTTNRGDATLEWWVEGGTLDAAADDPAATEVAWTLPTAGARNGPKQLGISVTARAEGCVSEVLSDAVTMDWPEEARVVVLYDPAVKGSFDVAEAYAGLHGIAADHLCAVSSPDPTVLPGADFPAFVKTVQACIDLVGDHVMYVVPVWGVPYKVSDRIHDFASGAYATVSLDALLSFGEDALDLTDAVYHPAWQGGDSLAGVYDPALPWGEVRSNNPRSRHLYMVARIDGSSAEAALDLVERTATAIDLAARGELAGTGYFDGRMGDTPPATDEFGSYESGEWNIHRARLLMEADGRIPVVWDGNAEEFGTAPAPLSCPDALYYAGWYSYGVYYDVYTWAPGAIGGHLDSCSACDIRAGGNWSAMALARGITATFGAVNEPYVAGMPEYDQLFLYLLQGASFGEAAYESTVVGAWMMVWVGDPLYRPYGVAG